MLETKIRTILLFTAVFILFTGCGQRRDPMADPGNSSMEPDEVAEASGEAPKPVMNPEEATGHLLQSALEGDLKKVEEALEAGAEINTPDPEGHTALMFAAYNGHSEIVLKLLDHGAGIGRRDVMGRTALLYAATGPFPETVRILLDKGAKPNVVDSDEHFSPLMHAAAEGNLDVVKILVEAGADATLKDIDGDDAYSFALQSGHQAVADFLKQVR